MPETNDPERDTRAEAIPVVANRPMSLFWQNRWAILSGGLLMPLIGFAVLAVLTFFPLLGLLFAPQWTLTVLYQAGFVPSVITAAAHIWLRSRPVMARRTIWAALIGATACFGWYVVLGLFPSLGWSQMFYCLIAAASSAIYFRLTRSKSLD